MVVWKLIHLYYDWVLIDRITDVGMETSNLYCNQVSIDWIGNGGLETRPPLLQLDINQSDRR